MLYLLLLLVPLASASLPRGADPANAASYTGPQFKCADGSQSFPLSYVNDDYCDCSDGSDEPGTAACPNGHFYCTNKGFKGQLMGSSRVDDGICDCCDGSDEKEGQCENTCVALGAQMAEAAKIIRKEQAIGFQQRLAYVADGKAAKARRDEDIGRLAGERDKLRGEMDEREKVRNEAEGPAKAAKEAAKAKFDAEEAARKEVEDEQIRKEAEIIFRGMDQDKDGETTLEEVQQYSTGEESLLDVDETLNIQELSIPDILESLQNKIRMQREDARKDEQREVKKKQKRAKKPELKKQPVPEVVKEEEEEEELWGEDGQKIQKNKEYIPEPDEFDDLDDEEEDEPEDVAPIRNTISYDAETQKLIDVFEEAETLYNEAKKQFEHAERQVEEVEKLNEIDFGRDEEFFSMRGECFELHDGKYKYKMCPFDQCTQDGTNIGKWEGWEKDGKGNVNYGVMLYSRGAGCWQGPNRSTRVEVKCGSKNEIVSAEEPAKCEYAYVFKTPAACTKVQEEHEIHDEL